MREWSHSKTVTHALQMLSYFKSIFKTKRVLCCVTCCVTIMDSKVKYICFHRPTLVFFLSFIPFEVWKFSFAPRAFVYNISWSWQRETWNPRFMSKQINVRNFWFKSIYRPKQGKKHVEGYWSRSMENKMEVIWNWSLLTGGLLWPSKTTFACNRVSYLFFTCLLDHSLLQAPR